MKVLVSGGAGYIGSHTVVQLAEAGHEPVIVDNFSNSKPTVIDRVEQIIGHHVTWYRADLTDRAVTERIFLRERPDAVIHFAGFKAVGESVAEPLKYYENNLNTTFSLIHGMQASGCRLFAFSSSATVYGMAPLPFTEEETDLSALSPYGYTKLAGERILTDIAAATDIRVALLRYFNPVGAHPSGLIGENPLGIPNNLMPAIANVATGRQDMLHVFGNDYPTPDGTCVRDYLHVVDLADAHIAAVEWLSEHDVATRIWNLGTGRGTSVLELVHAFERACGHKLPVEFAPRRPGDRDAYWASAERARDELGWVAKRSVDDMCADTWHCQQGNPDGFPNGEPASQPSQA
ncbi:UDP-glucose 4-epimerase GalE [Neoactinobaculum massilliense]|uniref:UDP-glucose 4-epimerase GalE n=1 Tax=Neoactinobaculum massilliense TaxID=2364794 RepID=UPI000F53867D|nr:UDP-glucose 4-epimerase GalE [Neoactinobaculum massilliense]